ncbi:MAG: hypothetical protein F6K19_37515 [Cyanothece sp. SIO1E1]|nr:hypothetical protein [Cyanothece sp. SIO1E1]
MAPSQPTKKPEFKEPKFGFNSSVERLNGRLAMLAFLTIIIIEYTTGQGFLSWLGWR